MNNKKQDISATRFYTSLLNGKIDEALRILSIYLISIGKSEYEFLLVRLVRLDIINGDEAFYKTMIALTEILDDRFNFSIDYYLAKFHDAIKKESYEEADIYLNIILRTKPLGFVVSYDLRNKLYLEINKIKPTIVRSNNYFGESKSKVDKIYDLLALGYSLEHACDTLRQGKNNYRRLALVLARDCYLVGDYEKGDFFLRKVEKVKNRPKFLDEMIREVKGRRNFYINDNYKVLSLKKK